MPSNLNPLGALPARFRRQRILIIGCGDVGLRVARLLPNHIKVLALTSSASRVAEMRGKNITPLLGNLDEPATLRRLAGLGTRVVHLAPPPNDDPRGRTDPRTRILLRSLRLRTMPRALVYGSTSGVYGDCQAIGCQKRGVPTPVRRVRIAGWMLKCSCAGSAGAQVYLFT